MSYGAGRRDFAGVSLELLLGELLFMFEINLWLWRRRIVRFAGEASSLGDWEQLGSLELGKFVGGASERGPVRDAQKRS